MENEELDGIPRNNGSKRIIKLEIVTGIAILLTVPCIHRTWADIHLMKKLALHAPGVLSILFGAVALQAIRQNSRSYCCVSIFFKILFWILLNSLSVFASIAFVRDMFCCCPEARFIGKIRYVYSLPSQQC